MFLVEAFLKISHAISEMINLTHVSKSYDSSLSYAVRDISLEVDEGGSLALLGESGCGKSTTLKMINRLIEVDEGRIEIEGRDIQERDPVEIRRSIGYVFQNVGLFPHLSVAGNVGAPLRLLRWEKSSINARVDELLILVGLYPDEYRARMPDQLSGGQKQRVGLARALAARPKIMLMDEPFGALDPLTRREIRKEFLRLKKELSLTVVVVTHDVTEALLMGDRIAVMERGSIIATGTPQALLENPGHQYAAALLDAPKKEAELLKAIMTGDKEKALAL